MRFLLLALALLGLTPAAMAQTPPIQAPVYLGAGARPTTAEASIILNADGTIATFGGGGGGTSDASAANQTTQITAANLTNTRIGDITSPVTGSMNQRLEAIRGAVAGTLTVATHAVTQSGTWNVGLTGTLPAFAATPTFNFGTLNGAATAANQTTANGYLSTIATASASTDPVPTISTQPASESFAQLALTAATRAQIATPITGMVNGIVCTAASTNLANVLVGGSAVSSVENGTGNGYPILPGGSWAAGVSTTASVYFISSAAAVVSCHGN